MKVFCILLLSLAAQTAASVLNAPTGLNLEQLRQDAVVLQEKLKAENCWNQQQNERDVIQKSSDGNELEVHTELALQSFDGSAHRLQESKTRDNCQYICSTACRMCKCG